MSSDQHYPYDPQDPHRRREPEEAPSYGYPQPAQPQQPAQTWQGDTWDTQYQPGLPPAVPSGAGPAEQTAYLPPVPGAGPNGPITGPGPVQGYGPGATGGGVPGFGTGPAEETAYLPPVPPAGPAPSYGYPQTPPSAAAETAYLPPVPADPGSGYGAPGGPGGPGSAAEQTAYLPPVPGGPGYGPGYGGPGGPGAPGTSAGQAPYASHGSGFGPPGGPGPAAEQTAYLPPVPGGPVNGPGYGTPGGPGPAAEQTAYLPPVPGGPGGPGMSAGHGQQPMPGGQGYAPHPGAPGTPGAPAGQAPYAPPTPGGQAYGSGPAAPGAPAAPGGPGSAAEQTAYLPPVPGGPGGPGMPAGHGQQPMPGGQAYGSGPAPASGPTPASAPTPPGGGRRARRRGANPPATNPPATPPGNAPPHAPGPEAAAEQTALLRPVSGNAPGPRQGSGAYPLPPEAPGAVPAPGARAADTSGYSAPTTTGNARITDAQRARAEGRSPIIAPGIQPAALTAGLGLLLAGGAALGPYGLLIPLVLLQAVTAAGWFRLNGMWPARQGIALAFAGGLVADGVLLAAGRDDGPAAILGTLGAWVLITVVLQLRSHASPDERMYGLMATVAAAAFTIVATGYLAAAPDAVIVGGIAVAAATFVRALPTPWADPGALAVLAAAGAGAAAGALTDYGVKAVVLGAAAGLLALVGLRVASYDYPSRFVHFTAGVALPLALAAPGVYLVGRVLA
ncbi:hypothetical protein ABZ714_02085 [Streptomyces sp. NPDC006798]|uniref:hypothetical protein n=1 Tax=Streptomyces sp. NPDC006798 TaxID=3155462 RepID=UPI0033D22C80